MLKLKCSVCKTDHITIRESAHLSDALFFVFASDGVNGGTLDLSGVKLLSQYLQDWLAQHADGEAKPC